MSIVIANDSLIVSVVQGQRILEFKCSSCARRRSQDDSSSPGPNSRCTSIAHPITRFDKSLNRAIPPQPIQPTHFPSHSSCSSCPSWLQLHDCSFMSFMPFMVAAFHGCSSMPFMAAALFKALSPHAPTATVSHPD